MQDKDILNKLNDMFRESYNTAQINPMYDYSKYVTDMMNIWNYVRSELGKQPVSRWSYSEHGNYSCIIED